MHRASNPGWGSGWGSGLGLRAAIIVTLTPPGRVVNRSGLQLKALEGMLAMASKCRLAKLLRSDEQSIARDG